MDVGVELCNVWASSVSTLLKACKPALLKYSNYGWPEKFGLLGGCLIVTGILQCSRALLVLEAGIKSVPVRRDGEHLWLFRCFWGTQKAFPKSIACWIVLFLHCLLRLALPACLLVWEKLRADTRGEDSQEIDIKSIEIISVIVILSNLRKAVVFTFSSRTEIHLYLLCRN